MLRQPCQVPRLDHFPDSDSPLQFINLIAPIIERLAPHSEQPIRVILGRNRQRSSDSQVSVFIGESKDRLFVIIFYLRKGAKQGGKLMQRKINLSIERLPERDKK